MNDNGQFERDYAFVQGRRSKLAWAPVQNILSLAERRRGLFAKVGLTTSDGRAKSVIYPDDAAVLGGFIDSNFNSLVNLLLEDTCYRPGEIWPFYGEAADWLIKAGTVEQEIKVKEVPFRSIDITIGAMMAKHQTRPKFDRGEVIQVDFQERRRIS